VSVVFASWAGFAGCVGSCRHAAAVLGGRAVAFDAGDPPEPLLEAELLVLSSWRPEYEELLARRRGPTVLRWHSSLLQTELSGELDTLADLVERVERGSLSALAASDPAVVEALAREGVVHLPDVLDAEPYAAVQPRLLDGTNVALFGEAHGRKSLLVQIAAFERVRAGREGWTLHLNGQSLRRPPLARWLALTGVPHVDHGFLERDAYLALLAGMDAGLAASLSESYGYLAAEHLLLGVPVVTSSAVVAVDPPAVERAWDPAEVADALTGALAGEMDVPAARARLLAGASERAATARATLERLLLLT
jgi:hypothetical protein